MVGEEDGGKPSHDEHFDASDQLVDPQYTPLPW
jgi:hypothetical protein